MNWKDKWNEWQQAPFLEDVLKKELATINDSAGQEDRFHQYLEFGTGGMRGEIGVGINRMNVYTIKRVALSLAIYMKQKDKLDQGVVISYDNRYFSKTFAEVTACLLATHNIKVYLSDCMRPTPELSFAVRKYAAYMGVMITASHNPKNYNGFKVYDESGGQITLEIANQLSDILDMIKNELFIETMTLDTCLKDQKITVFSKEMDIAYVAELQAVVQNKKMLTEHGQQLKVIYSPLHGTGEALIAKAYQLFGLTNLEIVKEQADGDPEFSTVKMPNPEHQEAFHLAVEKAKSQQADLVLATDPDADRLGVVVLNNNQPVYLNGNQIGVLLLDYLIKNQTKQTLANCFLAKTIVTSDLGGKLAKEHAVDVINTLTGFKFIGEQIQLAKKQKGKQFLFGYEESYGYLIEPFVRDKDAIQAALLLAEAALFYKLQNKSLLTALLAIYQRYGFYQESLETYQFKGIDGIYQMETIMNVFRHQSTDYTKSLKIKKKEDYFTGEIQHYSTNQIEQTTLPRSNVLKFIFEDDSWFCLRPSGTEPQLKIYFSVNDKIEERATAKLKQLKQVVSTFINEQIGKSK